MGFLLQRMGKGRQAASLGLRHPVQQELVCLIPAAAPVTLGDPGSAHLPRRLGLHRCLLHTISRSWRSIPCQSHQERSRRGRRHHDRWRVPQRVQQNLSFVIIPLNNVLKKAKPNSGMAHYEVRKYPGWHHHMLTSMLAHFFLWHLKLRLGKKSASADGITGADVAWTVVLPLRRSTIEDILELVAWVQRRNHQAYCSHRKRWQARGEAPGD